MNQVDCKSKKIEGFSRAALLLILLYFFSVLKGYGAALFLTSIVAVAPIAAFYTSFCSDVLGSMQSKRRKKGQFKNVLLIRKNMTSVMVFFAIVFGLITFFCSDKIASFMGVTLADSSLKMLAPVFLFLALETSLMAYFKGNGMYMPVVAANVVRPIGFLGFGMLLLSKGMQYGYKVARFLGTEEKAYIYGSGALCLAIVLTELLIVLLTTVMYLGSNHGKDRRKSAEGTRLSENTLDIIRNFFSAALGHIVGLILLLFALLWGMRKIYVSAVTVEDLTAVGGFIGAFLFVPLLVYVMIFPKAYALKQKLLSIKKIQDYKRTKRSMEMISMFSVRIGIYLTILSLIVAPYLCDSILAFGGIKDANIMNLGMFGVLSVCVSVVSLELMDSDKKKGLKFIMTAAAAITMLVCMMVLSGQNLLNDIAISFVAGMSLLMVLSLGYLLIRRYFQVNLIYMFVVPLISGAFTGIFLILGLGLIAPHIGPVISILIGTLLSLLIYFGILSAVRNITSHEIKFLYDKNTQKVLGLFIK